MYQRFQPSAASQSVVHLKLPLEIGLECTILTNSDTRTNNHMQIDEDPVKATHAFAYTNLH